jgi:hypothetical protein
METSDGNRPVAEALAFWPFVKERLLRPLARWTYMDLRQKRRAASLRPSAVEGLTIRLEDINNSPHGAYFIGGRKRLATCTSVKLLDFNRLVTCSLVGQRMYLIGFDVESGDYSIESCIPTRYRGRDICTDLLDYDGKSRLVTSNCEHGSISFYRVKHNSLEHEKDVDIPGDKTPFCHGVKFLPPEGRVICATTTSKRCQAYFISAESGDVIYEFGDGNWKVKDVCSVDNDRLIVLYASGTPTGGASAPYSSKISLVAYDLLAARHEVLHETVFAGHVDCCAYFDGRVLVSNQTTDSVTVFHVEAAELSYGFDSGGYDFPHGVDILPEAGLLAVTNYGSNSITLTTVAPALTGESRVPSHR